MYRGLDYYSGASEQRLPIAIFRSNFALIAWPQILNCEGQKNPARIWLGFCPITMSQMIVAIRVRLPSSKRWVHDLRASRLYYLFCECLDGSPQPLLHHNFRFITQQTAGPRNVCQRVTYIASLSGYMINICFDTDNFIQ
jgi:hypothetical protein